MSTDDDTDRMLNDTSHTLGDEDPMREKLRDYWRQCIRSVWQILQASKADGRRISQANLWRRFQREWIASVRSLSVSEQDQQVTVMTRDALTRMKKLADRLT